ncbi:phage capsid protein [Eremococcus coleocola]|uniref:phage capsid protein n=1 Tax=Eremococcus coleocola TaxID=88132 RepID=UPI00200AE907|nr:phage capsid protein [Eremococcus coleocola]
MYQPQYRQMLQTVFEARKAFSRAMAPLQILDGVQHNQKAFSVKTNNTPVVIGEYSTDANAAFGDGTAKSTRFGNMTEVIYADTDVEYDYSLAIHEGIDRFTVNNDLNAAVADRLKLQSEAQTRRANKANGKFISDNAAETKTLADFQETTVRALFNELSKFYIDNEVVAPVTAYVSAEVYNSIVDMAANTNAKGSSVSIDDNGLVRYKGFAIEETPTKYFEKGVVALFVPDGIIIPFIGINTARTIEAIDFDGVQLQAAAKGGTFTLDDNKKAIVKVTGTVPGA